MFFDFGGLGFFVSVGRFDENYVNFFGSNSVVLVIFEMFDVGFEVCNDVF